MTDRTVAQHRTSEERRPDWAAGSGETVVAIVDAAQVPTRAHALVAERRRVIVFRVTAAGGTPQQAAREIGTALRALGVGRFDLLGEGAGAAAALWLALAPEADVGSVVLAAPAGAPDDAVRELAQAVLLLCGTKDHSDSDRYRTLLPDCHFMFVYEAGRAMSDERPEALAFIALEFFERRDLFLVSRESGIALP